MDVFGFPGELVALLLGWLLGLLSLPIGDAIRRWRARGELATAIKAELAELRYTMALLADTMKSTTGQRDAGFLAWLEQTVAAYDGVDPEQPKFLAALRTLRSQLAGAAPPSQSSTTSGLSLKTYELPFLSSQVHKLNICSIAFQQRVVSDDIMTKVRGIKVRSHLSEILDIINGTGRRLRPVLQLRFRDLRLTEGPHGAICWPSDTDKKTKEWSAPINKSVRRALDRIIAERPGVGAAYLFPSPQNARRPVSRHLASRWLLDAEKKADLPKLDGSLWHAYRRKWATSRKGLPDVDVAAAGGWSDLTSLKTAYQQPDTATLYRVVSEPTELREVR